VQFPLQTRNVGRIATTFVDAVGQMFDAAIPYEVRFFESLDRMVQSQPWIARDRLAINMLRSCGIEKGKPFAPDAAAKEILTSAVREARAFFDDFYESYAPLRGQALVPALRPAAAGRTQRQLSEWQHLPKWMAAPSSTMPRSAV